MKTCNENYSIKWDKLEIRIKHLKATEFRDMSAETIFLPSVVFINFSQKPRVEGSINENKIRG